MDSTGLRDISDTVPMPELLERVEAKPTPKDVIATFHTLRETPMSLLLAYRFVAIVSEILPSQACVEVFLKQDGLVN